MLLVSGLAVAVPNAAAMDPNCVDGNNICDISLVHTVAYTVAPSTLAAFTVRTEVGSSNGGDFDIVASIVNLAGTTATFTSNGLTTQTIHHSPGATDFNFGTVDVGAGTGSFQVKVDNSTATYAPGASGAAYNITVTAAVVTPTPTPVGTPVTAVSLTCIAPYTASLDPLGSYGQITAQVTGGTNTQTVYLTSSSLTGGATSDQPLYTANTDGTGSAAFPIVHPGTPHVGTFRLTASVGGKTSNPCDYTVTVGQPANVKIVSPTSPTSITQGGTGSDLRAKVTDLYGNLVGSAPVTFSLNPVTGSPAPTITSTLYGCTVPGTSNTASATVPPAVFGYVDCGTITVGPNLGSFTVTATIPNGATDTSAQITVANGPATQFLYESGNPQSTAVNTPFGSPLKAIVEDASGNPVDGKLVSLSFTAAAGGAGLLGPNPSQLSGSDGVPGEVSFNVIANAIAGGPYQVTLTAFLGVNGMPTVPNFLTNTPATSNRVLSLVSGGNTSTAEGNPATVAAPIKIKVTDGSNNPVPNTQVQLFGPSGTGARADFGGGATSTSQNTDSTGVATFLYNAPCGLGSYNLVATTLNAQNALSIAETTIAGAASFVQLLSGNPQSAQVNTNFALPLSVRVLDTCNNPVAQNTTVTFTATPAGSGASLASSPLTALTDANGNASVTAAANTIIGSYTVAATVAGVATPATFNLTNTAGPVTSCTFVNSSTPATTVGTTFTPADFAVQAVDSFGNAVNGAPVLYMVPATGNPSVTGLTGGNTSGVSPNAGRFTPSGPVTANTMAGSYLVTATAAGVTCGTRSVTNNAGVFSQIIIGTPAAPITAANGFTDSAVIGQFFTKPIPFFVADQYGNPVLVATPVTFSAPADTLTNPTAAGTGGLTATTGANGQGTFAPASGTGFKAKNVPGSYNITATSGAITNSTVIQYTNLTAPIASCVFNQAIAQATVGTAFGVGSFAVTVKDSGTNPLNNATVVYTIAANTPVGATVNGITPVTPSKTGPAGTLDPGGTASNTAGTYTVSATASDGTTTVTCKTSASSPTIAVTNTAGTATQLVATSGTPQTAASGATFANLVAQLEDASGNPISTVGVVVNFTASPVGCVTNLPATGSVTTNASGQATFTAPIAQTTTTNVACTITATATGVAGTATFTLNITGTGGGGGTGLHLVLLSPTGSPVSVTRSGTNLIVQLQNSAGVGVSSPNKITGTITPASDGSQGVFTNGSLTQTVRTFVTLSNGAGVGSFVVLATRGSSVYTVTFTASGATPLTVNLRNPQNS